MTDTITLDYDSYIRYRNAYRYAIKEGLETITVDGNELYVGYLKYLVEYLKLKFEES